MTYLFTYSFSGTKNGIPTNGSGSLRVESDSDKITVESIYGKDGAIEFAKKPLEDVLDNVEVCPTGWFKFDDDGEKK